MKCIFVTLLVILSVACQNQEASSQAAENDSINRADLVGVWEQTALKVTYNTLDVPDSMHIFEIKEEEWIKTLSVKPVKTYFKADSTYRQDFIGLDENVYDSQRGLWNLIGDTLILISPNATYTYEIELSGNGICHYLGLLDWDGDGAEDDEYQATQRLISRNTQ